MRDALPVDSGALVARAKHPQNPRSGPVPQLVGACVAVGAAVTVAVGLI